MSQEIKKLLDQASDHLAFGSPVNALRCVIAAVRKASWQPAEALHTEESVAQKVAIAALDDIASWDNDLACSNETVRVARRALAEIRGGDGRPKP